MKLAGHRQRKVDPDQIVLPDDGGVEEGTKHYKCVGATESGSSLWIESPEKSWRTKDHFSHYRRARSHHSCGENNTNAKLTESDVVKIRERYWNGENSSELGKEYNVCPATIRTILLGTTWAHAGGPIGSKTIKSGARRGSNASLAVLNEKNVVDIRILRSGGLSYSEIGRRFGVSPQTIRHACLGKTWKHVRTFEEPLHREIEVRASRGHLLSGDDVRLLISLWNQGGTRDELAKRFGVSKTIVNNIIRLKTYSHVENRLMPRQDHAPKKLSDDRVKDVRKLFRDGKSQSEIVRMMGVSQPTVSMIISGKSYADILD